MQLNAIWMRENFFCEEEADDEDDLTVVHILQ